MTVVREMVNRYDRPVVFIAATIVTIMVAYLKMDDIFARIIERSPVVQSMKMSDSARDTQLDKISEEMSEVKRDIRLILREVRVSNRGDR